LILYLHGAGSRGNNLDYLKLDGLPKKLEGDHSFPFLVVSPQIEDENTYWPDGATIGSLFALLEEIRALYPIDPKRIYLSGVSLGGNGRRSPGESNIERAAARVAAGGI
jgi:predicted peptidase